MLCRETRLAAVTLRLMILVLGLGGPLGAAFHLTVHATFKSALFLSIGALERATGTRDLGQLGGLGKRLPWTAGAFIASALSLAGIPPLADFCRQSFFARSSA